ncbi:hypothetical protein ACH4C2_16370 [Streptomyces sp. NPDC018057]|uniref:hypothetical protein n=1 Tax=unclassified Streptomyces TaxID=2593676 RepID=UPI003790CE12
MGQSQTSLLMAVGRPGDGPTEGERASDGLRCAHAGRHACVLRGAFVPAAAQASRTHLDPIPRSSP